MSAEPDLLPCPFCGGTEIYIGPMHPPSAWEYWVVGCNNDDCPLDADSVKVEGGTLEKAAAAWNTRATDANLAALQAESERLQEQLRLATVDQATAEAEASDAHAEIEALRAEVERLNRILGRIVELDGDSTLTISAGTDAFAAAREYLLPNT